MELLRCQSQQRIGKHLYALHQAGNLRVFAGLMGEIFIIREGSAERNALFEHLGIPTTMKELGLDEEILPMTFKATKDIRDKYVLSKLAWDLGIIEELQGESI